MFKKILEIIKNQFNNKDITLDYINDFEETLYIAKKICRDNPKALVDLVKLLGRVYQSKHMSLIVTQASQHKIANLEPELILFNEFMMITQEPNSSLFYTKKKINYSRPLKLKTDLILPWPWDKNRIASNLCCIGQDRSWGNWKQNDNHHIEYWLPMGIGWVKQGNHSITNGIINGVGIIRKYDAYDISGIYKLIACDGKYFYRIEDNKKIQAVKNYEFACIFEIGRLMHEKGISA